VLSRFLITKQEELFAILDGVNIRSGTT
jgi:hypothetical protein